MSRTDLTDLPVYCIVCAEPVPEERQRFKAITCTVEHQKAREAYTRSFTERKKGRADRADLTQLPVYCIVCAEPVPEDRKRFKARTCSAEHQKTRAAYTRSLADRKKCRYCLRPSTPEQRGLFTQWRRFNTYVRRAPALPMLLAQVQCPEVLLPTITAKERAQLVVLLERVLAQNLAPDLPPLPTKAQKRTVANAVRIAGETAAEDETGQDANEVLEGEY